MVAIFTRLRKVSESPPVADEPDSVLVARALRDREAFAALYVRYVEEVGRFCRLRLHDEEAARDVTQQIFAQAMAGLTRYHETGQFRAWLYTIARHVLANHTRDRRFTLSLDAAMQTIDPDSTPEEAAAAAWDRRAVLEAVARLPDDQRTAVELRLAGLKGDEVAAVMGRSHDAVKKLQLRALEKLRRDLGTYISGEEDRHGA